MLDQRFSIPDSRKVRVIISTDAANEADDAFAVAHALLTPSFDVRGIIATRFSAPDSVARSMAELRQLAGVLGSVADVPLVRGSESPLGATAPLGHGCPLGCREAVELIVREAFRQDPRPLYVLCMGGLTEVAAALRTEPEIARRMTVVWVGGGRYPSGGHEANLARDLVAAREVFASTVPVWQIPSGAYKRLAVSLAELRVRLSRCGQLGAHLWGQLNAFASANVAERTWIHPESWVLGDNAAVGVLLAEQKACFDVREAPGFADDFRYVRLRSDGGQLGAAPRSIRVYGDLDARLILEDMFAKYELWSLGLDA